MNRSLTKSFLSLAVVCVFLSWGVCSIHAQSSSKPNFVIIMADDLGYGDLSCYGSTKIQTPHLDKLAAQGIRFTDFHSSGAVCSPTRAGLMTGRYQQRVGVPAVIVADPKAATHPHGLQAQETTFAELLKQNGYQTAIFGKWHLGYYPVYNPVRHGFNQFRGYISGNVDFFSHVDQAGRLDWWRDESIADEPGYTTHLITKYSVDFIKQNHDKPFCLYIAYEPPHYPYQGPNDKPVREVGKPRSKAELKQPAKAIQRAYKEMVEEMDKGIGEIVQSLKENGIEQKTLVLFFSDNGATNRGSRGGLKGTKGNVWEGGHRVPGIAYWPGTIKPNQVNNQLVTTLDVMPTVLAAAEVNIPSTLALDGQSILSLLTRGEELPPRQVAWGTSHGSALRDGPWKLIELRKGKAIELYNLADDINETTNLVDKHPERVKTMRAALAAWNKEVHSNATQQPTKPPTENSTN